MPARCTRSTQALRSSCVSVTLPLYGGWTPGYGVLSAIVRSENDPSTVCSDVAPNLIHSSPKPVVMPAVIMEFRTRAARLVADAVQQVAARADVLERREIAALVMDAGQPVPDELFRDVRQPVAFALLALLGREGRSLPHAIQCAARAIGHSAVEVPPLASLSNVPPGGFGVSFVMWASSSALLL